MMYFMPEGNEAELYISRLENVKRKRNPYLLETSDCRVVPIRINTTFYITSNDVLHAFSLPGTFSKCDAVPRRLNAMSISFPHHIGKFDKSKREIRRLFVTKVYCTLNLFQGRKFTNLAPSTFIDHFRRKSKITRPNPTMLAIEFIRW